MKETLKRVLREEVRNTVKNGAPRAGRHKQGQGQGQGFWRRQAFPIASVWTGLPPGRTAFCGDRRSRSHPFGPDRMTSRIKIPAVEPDVPVSESHKAIGRSVINQKRFPVLVQKSDLTFFGFGEAPATGYVCLLGCPSR